MPGWIKRSCGALIVTCAVLLNAIPDICEASVVVPMSDMELVQESGLIVHGRVSSVVSAWNEQQNQIFSFINIDIMKQLKGSAGQQRIKLRTLGGFVTKDGIGMSVVGSPSFELGEEIVVFLKENPEVLFPVTGFNQGKMRVEVDASANPPRKFIRQRSGQMVDLDRFLNAVELMVVGVDLQDFSALQPPQPSESEQGKGVRRGVITPLPSPTSFDGVGAAPIQSSSSDDNSQGGIAGNAFFFDLKLQGSSGSASPLASPALSPDALPPFLHWDLREFTNCTVPYSFHNGTADIPGTQEFDAIDAAFTTWQNVDPSVIRFQRVLAAGLQCPMIKDSKNTVGWNSFNCNAAIGDDTCEVVVSDDAFDAALVNPMCGAACGANATIIVTGADNILQTSPNNCLCIGMTGDDVLDNTVNPPVIKDGGNGMIETAPVNQNGCNCHALVKPNSTLVARGADGWLTTQPNNCCDDRIGVGPEYDENQNNLGLAFGIIDGGDGIRQTFYNDGMDAPSGVAGAPIAPFCAVIPGQFLRPLGTQFTPPNNKCDDKVVLQGGQMKIVDGGDGIVTTKPGVSLSGSTFAFTAVFYEGPRTPGSPNSGRILEADILFNDAFSWEVTANPPGLMNGNPDVESVALHEIGHWIGLHHPNDNGVSNGPGGGMIMSPYMTTANPPLGAPIARTLQLGDERGVNFLYTPDLGDAPDPVAGTFNEYQTLVHGSTPSRTLNGIQLHAAAKGPVHLFGFKDEDAVIRFEWLGDDENGHKNECETLLGADGDQFDDGVRLVDADGTAVDHITRGQDNYFEIIVSHLGHAGRYVNDVNQPRNRLYVNGYLDLDGDGVFGVEANSDLEMWWAGVPVPCTTFNSYQLEDDAACDNDANPKKIKLRFKVSIPNDAPELIHGRFRVDWGEDLGYVQIDNHWYGVSGDLIDGEGAAQFGEVEDYAFTAGGKKNKCPADISPTSGDGQVNVDDLVALLGAWGPCVPPCQADIAPPGGDGLVNVDDLVFLLGSWGPC